MKAVELVNMMIDIVGPLNVDEGVRFGDLRSDVTGVCICWMATDEAIEFARNNNANFIVCHEDLFLPYGKMEGCQEGSDFLSWDVNRHRVELLSKYSMTVMRLHGSLDRKYIFDAFAKQLGLTKKHNTTREYSCIYEVQPIELSKLILQVKEALNLDGVRAVAANGERIVSKIGLLVGGMGLFVNSVYVNNLLIDDPEVCIAGETDNYVMRMLNESGVDLIETSHELSENEGLKQFSNELKTALNEINVIFYDMRRCWKVV